MTLESLVLLIHSAATWVMVGVIWIVQLVHYPLFDRVERERFSTFALDHQRLIFPIVAPAMLTELLTGIALLILAPAMVAPIWLWVGMILIVVNAVSTAVVQIPLHQRLARGFDADAHRRLVRSNWLRTIAWSLRGVLVLFLLRAMY